VKIALCDDRKNDRTAMETLILELYSNAEIHHFENGFVLLEFLEQNSRIINILILDMKMPHLNGVDTAAEIKRCYPHLPIIAVTLYPAEYAVPAYEFSPVHFLVKPITHQSLKSAFVRAIKGFRPDTELLSVQFMGIIRYLPLDTICSIQSDGKRVKIITQDESIETSKTLDYYEKTLADKGFFRIRKSGIINLDYVREVDTTSKSCAVILQNGSGLPVAKRRRNDLFDRLIQWRRVNA